MSRFFWFGVYAVCLGLLSPAWAADWPTYAKDLHRSNVTDETLAFPLQRAWTYQCAQAPRPAWPEPEKVLNRLDFDYAFHPVVADGIVCFGSSADDTVRALDAITGKEKWHFITGGPVRVAPQITGGKVYVSSDDGFIYCVDAATGKLTWKFNAAPSDERMVGNERVISRWPTRTGVLVDNGVVYCTAGMWASEGVFVYALNAATGTIIWCNDTSGLIYDARTLHMGADFATYGVCPQGPMLATDDILLVPTGKALPAAYDRKTGKLLYYRISAEYNQRGGTWITIDGNKFYTTPYVSSFVVSTGELAGRIASGNVPPYSTRVPGTAYSVYEKVSAIVKGNTPIARKAYGMIMAGTTLLIGQDGAVVAESTTPKTAAELRFGLAGDDLTVFAKVNDTNAIQAPQPWDGSCIELFGSMPGKSPIGQVFLLPGTQTAPAVAFRSLEGKIVPAPEIRVKSTPIATGYELSALIPLSHLALNKANPDCRLESQVTIPGPDGTLLRNTLFGSVSAHQDNAKYGRFLLKPREALHTPDDVKAALAAVKPNTITMPGGSILWREKVDGEARGIAVANGRLFISTSQGKLYCFAPVSAANSVAHTSQMPQLAPAQNEKSKTVLEQLRETGMDRGYALVFGDADAGLSMALAQSSRLHVVTVLTDETAATALREKLLSTTTLYGSQIHVQVVPDLTQLPFATYFANAIIVANPVPELSGSELYRVLRPCGGVMLFPGLSQVQAEAIIRSTGAPSEEMRADNRIVRGRLQGALDWDSPYPLDQRVKWPLRLLWFGGPGPADVMDRKEFTDIGPAANGRFFTFAKDSLTAVDAYNGAVLWSRPIPKTFADLKLADDTHLIADAERLGGKDFGRQLHADGKSVYLTMKGYLRRQELACVQLDARTGEQQKIYGTFNPPQAIPLSTPQTWPLEIDATHDGALTLQQDADGLLLKLTTRDPVVTGVDRWDLFFDFRPAEKRYGLYEKDTFSLMVFPADGRESAKVRPGIGKAFPKAVVTGTRTNDATTTTVRLSWDDIVRLTGEKPTSFGFGARLNAFDGGAKERIVQRYLFCDLAADGLNNGWATVVLIPGVETTATPPPIIAGTYAALPKLPQPKGRNPLPGSQPAMQEPRRHPFTGELQPKLYQAGTFGCGGLAYSTTTIFTRSTAIGIYDFADDSGMRTFDGLKPGCATTMTASQGLLLSVEGRGGCECTTNFQTSMALAPVEKRSNEDWALYFDRDVDSRVKSMALNFGAPGDRRADDGTLWLGFPRIDKGKGYPQLPPNATGLGFGRREVAGNLRIPLQVDTFAIHGTYRVNADRVKFDGTDRPWIYASGFRGIQKATLKLNYDTPLISTPVAQPPVLDGKSDDFAWTDKAQSTLEVSKTEVFLRHDDANLYLLARRPSVISTKGDVVRWTKTVVKDDMSFYNDDCWEVFFSDARSGKVVHLRVMTSGAKFDAFSESPAMEKENVKWNGVWQHAEIADDKGFTVEMAIPWSTLVDAGLNKDSLTINFMMNGPFRATEALRFLGMRGRERCENLVPLGMGDAPGALPARSFTVRLHFAEPDAIAVGQRVFDVKLQGKTVLTNFDIVKEAGGVRKALVKELKIIQAGDILTLEFLPLAGTLTEKTVPLLCGLELFEE